MRSRRLLFRECLRAVAAAIGLLAPGLAQEPTAAVAEVARLLTSPSPPLSTAMTFRGVVTHVGRNGEICVQEGSSGVLVDPPPGAASPAMGDEIEITAEPRFTTTDATSSQARVAALSWRILGSAPLPEPGRPWLLEALNGKFNRRWVEIEGMVMQMALDQGRVLIHLTDQSGWAVVTVHHWNGAPPREWWGAKLRITCANIGRGHDALRAATSDQITVLAPGAGDLFAVPAEEAGATRSSPARADRVRLKGTVLAQHGDYVYVRSGDQTAWRFTFLHPFVSTENPPHALELIPPPIPALAPGDHIEVVGSPLRVGAYLQLSFSSVRILGHGPLPSPAPLYHREAADHAHLCDLVRLEALVPDPSPGQASDGRIFLEAGGAMLEAALPPSAPVRPWRPGERVKVTGVLAPSENASTPLLLIPDAAAIRHVGYTPPLRKMNPATLKLVGFLAGGLACALGLACWLQRLVKQRTAALATANDSLREEISAHQKTEAELHRALANERELGELKHRFVTMVSHEFRTPLGITMSAVELLRNYEERLTDAQRRELLDDIHRSTRGMGGLMEQVLVLGRVGSDTALCRPAPCSLDELAHKLADESLSATNRRCPIEWRPENDLSGAEADVTLLRHIFSNLLSNAVKYSPEGAPVVFACRREGCDAVFTVTDQGLGIPEADWPRLFEAFHRCGNASDIPGTGLGLVIVKRCVDLHGGALHFESRLNEGTTFTVRLPLWKC